MNQNLVSSMFMDNNQENSSKSHPSKQTLLLSEGMFPNSFGLTSPCLVLAKYEIPMYYLLFLVPLSFLLGREGLLRLMLRDILASQCL